MCLESLRKMDTTISYAEKGVGGLSKPSKMPWYGYSIPAIECKTGSILRVLNGSVCSKCYACKGRYSFDNVVSAMNRRWRCLTTDIVEWAAHMVALLEMKARGSEQYFRWHDSGDVQSYEHIEAIIWIAKQLPHIHFWLPSKERNMFESERILEAMEGVKNLTVRISAFFIGEVAANKHYPTSCVDVICAGVFRCPANAQNGKCGDCRACWSKKITTVNYPLH